MHVIGLSFYLFGAIDFLLWLFLDINLTHTSWSPIAAGVIGRACIAFGAVHAPAPRRFSPSPSHGVDAGKHNVEPQPQNLSAFTAG